MIPALLIGLYLIVAGVLGNGQCVYEDVIQQRGFIPWITAVFILWLIWEYSPEEIDKPARALIIVLLLGFIIINFKIVQSKIDTLWGGIQKL